MTSLMRRLADLPIRSRIAIVCLIPLLAFTGFAGKQMLEKHTTIGKPPTASRPSSTSTRSSPA